MKIAVLLATFNRKKQTLSCLKSLFSQQIDGEAELKVFLTDDASSDGTAEAVQREFPAVHLLKGSGALFWAGGMRNTWTEALKFKADYYLLLNDDTLLVPQAIHKLLAWYKVPGNKPAICIGSTLDVMTRRISYGGQKLYNLKKVQSFNVYSEAEYRECDMANANIMLVPAVIVKEIGILSTTYTHSIADFDYTLRAKKAGFSVMVVPGIQGFCTDDHGKNWKTSAVSLADRIRYLKSPKGLAYDEYMQFIRLHFPTHVNETFVKLWMKTLFPVMWDNFKRQH